MVRVMGKYASSVRCLFLTVVVVLLFVVALFHSKKTITTTTTTLHLPVYYIVD